MAGSTKVLSELPPAAPLLGCQGKAQGLAGVWGGCLAPKGAVRGVGHEPVLSPEPGPLEQGDTDCSIL